MENEKSQFGHCGYGRFDGRYWPDLARALDPALIDVMTATSPERPPSLRAHEPNTARAICPVKGKLSQELSTVEATISSLQNHLDKPQTVMALVHPECLRFELQGALERKTELEREYEQHLTVHRC